VCSTYLYRGSAQTPPAAQPAHCHWRQTHAFVPIRLLSAATAIHLHVGSHGWAVHGVEESLHTGLDHSKIPLSRLLKANPGEGKKVQAHMSRRPCMEGMTRVACMPPVYYLLLI